MNCPHCHQPIVVSINRIELVFDPSDEVQQMGYDHAKFNREKGDKGTFKNCPYSNETPEFYRYNRGMGQFWNQTKK